METLCSVVAGTSEALSIFVRSVPSAQLRYALELADTSILARGRMSVESVHQSTSTVPDSGQAIKGDGV